MPIWAWLLVFLVGLIVIVFTIGVTRRRASDIVMEPQREGFGSFLYYGLIDWWVSWLRSLGRAAQDALARTGAGERP